MVVAVVESKGFGIKFELAETFQVHKLTHKDESNQFCTRIKHQYILCEYGHKGVLSVIFLESYFCQFLTCACCGKTKNSPKIQYTEILSGKNLVNKKKI